MYEPTSFNLAAEQAAYWSRDQFEVETNREDAARHWEFLSRLRSLTDAVARDDRAAVAEVLGRAQEERRMLGPQTVGVRVALADEPGVLARVGRAFERAGVDILTPGVTVVRSGDSPPERQSPGQG